MIPMAKERDGKRTRHQRSDSHAAALKAMRNVQDGIPRPPDYIDFPDSAWPYWEAIFKNRAADRWNALDLANAAELAMVHDDMARLRAKIREQGDVLEGDKPNPAHKLLDNAGRRAIALSRMLHVHPEATEGRSRDSGNALKNEREAERTLATVHPLIRVK